MLEVEGELLGGGREEAVFCNRGGGIYTSFEILGWVTVMRRERELWRVKNCVVCGIEFSLELFNI